MMTEILGRGLLLLALASVPSVAHPHGGGVDSLGCHHDRRAGGYHCHRGELAGRSFASKADALKALEQLRSGKPSASPSQAGAPASSARPSTQSETNTLTAAEAKNHIGEVATVCGKAVSTRYAASSRGRPTFLNLDKPYPNQVFTIVIWGENRAEFGEPEERYKDKEVCATGKIESYRGVPQITATDPEQVKIHSKDKE